VPPQTDVTFRGQATEVIVPVTVTDEKGKFLSNLVAGDFQILDEAGRSASSSSATIRSSPSW